MRPVMHRLRTLPWAWIVTLVTASAAQAQVPGLDALQRQFEQISETHWRMTGDVELETPGGVTLLADRVDYFTDTKRLLAEGNVVFAQSDQRITADRAEFDVEASTGTFYNASGSVTIGARKPASMFGTQEPDVMFHGEMIEKIGPRRYRITRGAFTTCVQPTPRWEVSAGTVVLNVDEYAVLRNALLKVKNVPVLYLPIFYYPINREDRATGFLIPQYGVSTIRGHTIGNAFFWAINRSQDATFNFDMFSRTGRGTGGQYRYVAGPRSEGNVGLYLLDEHAATYQDVAGTTTATPARRSYEIQGAATHDLGAGLRARGRVDYFSDITVQQTYHTNIYEASRRSRAFAGSLTGNWGVYAVTGAYERSETFFGTTSSTLNGGAPQVSFSRAKRPIGRSPVYFSIGGDYDHLLRERRSGSGSADQGLDRFDLYPQIRVPFTRWPFLTINSTLTWRYTLWSESLDENRQQIQESISRRYFDVRSEIVGPVFSRIFNTPDNGYADRFKHTIEPFFGLERVSAIDQFDRIVRLDRVDSVVGRSTEYNYGVRNRLYARRQEGGSERPNAREIAQFSLSQSYYTDAEASKYDEYYRTSFNDTLLPSHFSPVSIVAEVAPTRESSAGFRAEYDTQFMAFRSMGAEATIVLQDRLQSTVGWSQRRFIEELRGFNDPDNLDHFLSQSTLIRTRDNRFGGLYTFNYDVRLGSFLQQRILGYYNAQCCGFTVEYQTYDLSRLGSRAPVTQDRRFNFSFTLAGIGSFSNFFGALGGAQ